MTSNNVPMWRRDGARASGRMCHWWMRVRNDFFWWQGGFRPSGGYHNPVIELLHKVLYWRCQCGEKMLLMCGDGIRPTVWRTFPEEPTVCDEDVDGPPIDNPGFTKSQDFAEWDETKGDNK